MKKSTKKLIKKIEHSKKFIEGEIKNLKKKEDFLFVAGLITKGKDKGKYVAVQVRNTKLLNPVEPIFELHKGMEFVIVGRNEKVVREVFGNVAIKNSNLLK